MPSTPTLSLLRTSGTSFQATVGSDTGVTNRLFYQLIGSGFVTGGTVVGPGLINQVNLAQNGQYQAYVVSDSAGCLSFPALSTVSLASTDSVLGAIQQKFAANPTLAAQFPGGLWTGEVPDTINVFPYAMVQLYKTRSEFTFEATSYYEINTVKVDCYAIGADAAETSARQIKVAFDWSTLPFATASTISIIAEDYLVVSEVFRSQQEELVFRATLEYQIAVNRST